MWSRVQDPKDHLDYVFNWSPWLQDGGETIESYVITAETGITVGEKAECGGKVTVWLSGGTAGANYMVSCRITTSVGRIAERSMLIKVRQR